MNNKARKSRILLDDSIIVRPNIRLAWQQHILTVTLTYSTHVHAPKLEASQSTFPFPLLKHNSNKMVWDEPKSNEMTPKIATVTTKI